MTASTTPLVLLPGLLCDGALWRHQTETLGDAASFTIGDFTDDDSIEAMARSVLIEAPENFALAGLSMGGYVALEIMRQAPDRVTRLALLDTSARADTPENTVHRGGLIELARKGRFKGVTPRLLPLLIHPDRLDDEELTGCVMAMAERIGKDAFLRQQSAILKRIDSRPHLSAIHCPTLVLCGRQDALTPLEVHQEMAGAMPRASLVVVEDCGHLATLEQPQAVNAALRDWLQIP
ncbi:MAG: alpha/beta fold hydrolase [Rhodospirillales bacterium]|jgi:pimeloyl-ACP methyl ester carboxylesterase|nr:alpha/beta fold hydrolase [Rhodospirillales bacterium]MDP6773227.1 alpha/beta fold hydrolase [Rhodospirillales bacterium]|tara:strand:- start:68 stop:775 length:708 start_codon:yes stop_codon:yes gene_type:complete